MNPARIFFQLRLAFAALAARTSRHRNYGYASTGSKHPARPKLTRTS